RIIRHVLEPPALADAGVVVEHVHGAAGLRTERGDGLLEVLLQGHVEAARDAVVAADLLGERGEPLRIDVEGAAEPALLGEQRRRRAADAARSPGDEDRFASLGLHVISASLVTVFQLRAVPRAPRWRSMTAPVSFDAPAPSGK